MSSWHFFIIVGTPQNNLRCHNLKLFIKPLSQHHEKRVRKLSLRNLFLVMLSSLVSQIDKSIVSWVLVGQHNLGPNFPSGLRGMCLWTENFHINLFTNWSFKYTIGELNTYRVYYRWTTGYLFHFGLRSEPYPQFVLANPHAFSMEFASTPLPIWRMSPPNSQERPQL